MQLPVKTPLRQNNWTTPARMLIVQLPVKTPLRQNGTSLLSGVYKCNYQSKRHYAKTSRQGRRQWCGAITSQNATTPKHLLSHNLNNSRAITSQNATTPKHVGLVASLHHGAITSQNATTPKPTNTSQITTCGAITSQNATTPKHQHTL